jgi:hypothetical protein
MVSGLVIAHEFGTNWARFSDRTGAVVGPLISYEVLTGSGGNASVGPYNSSPPRLLQSVR